MASAGTPAWSCSPTRIGKDRDRDSLSRRHGELRVAINDGCCEQEVRHTTLTDQEWRDAKIAGGMPAMYADMLLGTFRAARNGDFAAIDPLLDTLLGRAPRTMRDVLSARKPHSQ